MTAIIGKRINAPACCDIWVGADLPDDPAWRAYVVSTLPAGLILQYEDRLCETLGGGRARTLTVDTAGEFVGVVL